MALPPASQRHRFIAKIDEAVGSAKDRHYNLLGPIEPAAAVRCPSRARPNYLLIS